MRSLVPVAAAALGVGLWCGLAFRAQAQLLGNTRLWEQLEDLELRGRWYYDDLGAAMAEARRTGKPLLVVLRCPP